MLCLILSQYTKWNLFKYGINTLCISNARKKAIRPNHVATKMKEETKQNTTVIADHIQENRLVGEKKDCFIVCYLLYRMKISLFKFEAHPTHRL